LIREFGGRVTTDRPNSFVVGNVGSYRATSCDIEPDASSASYAFATAAATGGRITVPGLGTSSLQGDYGFVDILEKMGVQVERSPQQTRVTGGASLRAVDVDMHHVSDTVMTLAALAALAQGETRALFVPMPLGEVAALGVGAHRPAEESAKEEGGEQQQTGAESRPGHRVSQSEARISSGDGGCGDRTVEARFDATITPVSSWRSAN
jgi:hypothetical protein